MSDKFYEPTKVSELEARSTSGKTLAEEWEALVEDWYPPETPFDFEDALERYERGLKIDVEGIYAREVRLPGDMDHPLLKELRKRARRVRREMAS